MLRVSGRTSPSALKASWVESSSKTKKFTDRTIDRKQEWLPTGKYRSAITPVKWKTPGAEAGFKMNGTNWKGQAGFKFSLARNRSFNLEEVSDLQTARGRAAPVKKVGDVNGIADVYDSITIDVSIFR
jgi:hypothetical protein